MKNCEIKTITEEEYEEWDAFVDISPQGNIFNKSFWIRTVSDEFEILALKENGKIIGGIVLPSVKGKFFRNPKLTPQLGILLLPEDLKVKYSTRLSKDMDVITTIIESLPKFKQFNYGFSYNFTNLVPFIWNDFNIKLRYTYVIEDLSNLDEVFSNFQYDCKYLIKRALKNNIIIRDDYSIKDFYNVNKMTFDRQKMDMPYSLEFLEELDKNLTEKNCRKMFFAENSSGELVAATYLVYDNNCTYYLMGGADPEYRKLGVQTLLVWESIKFAASIKTKFDFEGSMIKSIEKSFREFGGKQNIIYNVYKSDAVTEFLYGIAMKNKTLVKKLLKV